MKLRMIKTEKEQSKLAPLPPNQSNSKKRKEKLKSLSARKEDNLESPKQKQQSQYIVYSSFLSWMIPKTATWRCQVKTLQKQRWVFEGQPETTT